MTEMTEKALVSRYLREGDERALETLIGRFLPAVFGYVRNFTGNPDIAADIAQETFVKAWKNLKRYNPAMEFKGWLFTIAKRTAIDELRKKRASPFSVLEGPDGAEFAPTIPDEGPSVSQIAETVMDGRMLSTALASLPAIPAAVVRMRTSDDLTFGQIARELRIPLNTVKSHYRRALRVLGGIIRR